MNVLHLSFSLRSVSTNLSGFPYISSSLPLYTKILNQNNADNASYITILTEPYVPTFPNSNA